ncbi:MAG: phosphatidate cytidylyltransferase [Gammaproteobacteria bacterium]|nr:phosphatidate cytidylyltransferase [Gammaproteobacteria bacterium]
MLWQRVITALLLLPIALGALFMLPIASFAAFCALVMAGCAWEWTRLVGLHGHALRAAYVGLLLALFGLLTQLSDPFFAWPAALSQSPPQWVLALGLGFWSLVALPLVLRYPASAAVWRGRGWLGALMGLALFLSTWVALVSLRAVGVLDEPLRGGFVLLYMLGIIWAADIGAYFAGKALGRRKLAPMVSPGKTVEGFLGGLGGAAAVGIAGALALELPLLPWWPLAALILGTALVSVLGDLFESMMKRAAGVKDSGSLLPGHGGVLDRLDSLLAAGPVFAWLFLAFGLQ